MDVQSSICLDRVVQMTTIGSLANILKKYHTIASRVFDVFCDEAGQMFHLNAMLFLGRLPNVQRLFIIGDSRQLPPYVTKLLKRDFVQSSFLFHCLHKSHAHAAKILIDCSEFVASLKNPHAPILQKTNTQAYHHFFHVVARRKHWPIRVNQQNSFCDWWDGSFFRDSCRVHLYEGRFLPGDSIIIDVLDSG